MRKRKNLLYKVEHIKFDHLASEYNHQPYFHENQYHDFVLIFQEYTQNSFSLQRVENQIFSQKNSPKLTFIG